jgi:release factor glutamine methyltransferase
VSAVAAPETRRAALEAAAGRLRAAGIDSAAADAEWLLAGVLGVSRGALRVEAGRPLDPAGAARYASAVRRRAAREPLQHILGTQAFRGLVIEAGPEALVPRPETEGLAGWAIELLPRGGLAIDVGTGSGCIAGAIAAERPDADVVALEIAPAAAALARRNVAALRLPRVTVLVSDLLVALPAATRADVVVCNPPYLPTALIDTLPPEVSRHDPRPALDGGPDGLDVIRRVVAAAPPRLRRGGALVLETAGGEQARAVASLMDAAGFGGIAARCDLAGVERLVAGRVR